MIDKKLNQEIRDRKEEILEDYLTLQTETSSKERRILKRRMFSNIYEYGMSNILAEIIGEVQ